MAVLGRFLSSPLGEEDHPGQKTPWTTLKIPNSGISPLQEFICASRGCSPNAAVVQLQKACVLLQLMTPTL